MSEFIVPLSGLPSITSLQEKQQPAASGGLADKVPFADVLQSAVESLTTQGQQGQSSMYDLALGQSDDLHTGAIDMVKYNTAVSFTSGMVSSVIRAYNELMRMSI